MLWCSFCRKQQDEVKFIMKGDCANICDQCLLTCIKIMFYPDRAMEAELLDKISNQVNQILSNIQKSEETP